MTFKQICSVKNHQLIITLPDNFEDNKKVMVMIDDEIDNRMLKLEQLREAMTDPLFLEDIAEISNDFKSIDNNVQ
jgi:hypothetical protein